MPLVQIIEGAYTVVFEAAIDNAKVQQVKKGILARLKDFEGEVSIPDLLGYLQKKYELDLRKISYALDKIYEEQKCSRTQQILFGRRIKRLEVKKTTVYRTTGKEAHICDKIKVNCPA